MPGRDLPPPGEPFPGLGAAGRRWCGRDNASVFSLLDQPIVVWDEPEQVRGAAERFWKRLEQIRALAGLRSRTGSTSAGKIWSGRPQRCRSCRLKELEIGWEADGDGSRCTLPRGPRWPSTATCRWPSPRRARWWKRGNRVAFFASSTGEVERVADILNEYGVPYQLGLEQIESTPAYLAERAYMAGSVASIYLVKGLIRRGTAFQDSKLVVFGSEDLFETSELVARAPSSQVRAGALFRPT